MKGEKSFVVRIERDKYRHSLKLLGNRIPRLEDFFVTSGITTCGIMTDGKLVQEEADCPKCLLNAEVK